MPPNEIFPKDVMGQNFTLYLRRENSPNANQFDAVSQYDSATQNYVVEFENPIVGTWYLAVENNLNITVNFSLSYEILVCPGQLRFGPNCSSTFTNITGWYNMTEFTATGKLQYFAYYNASLKIGVGYAEVNNDTWGAPALYASLVNWPTHQTNGYMAGGPSQGSLVNFLDLQLPNISLKYYLDWFIAVEAPAMSKFYLWVGDIPVDGEVFGSSLTSTY